jgi:hypothetical protein
MALLDALSFGYVNRFTLRHGKTLPNRADRMGNYIPFANREASHLTDIMPEEFR